MIAVLKKLLPAEPTQADLNALLVQRAESCLTRGIHYGLSHGGYDPTDAHPGGHCHNKEHAHYGRLSGKWCADCSGFVAWLIGLSRDPKVRKDGWKVWLDTDHLHEDARKAQRYLQQIAGPESGCIVVFPDAYTRDVAGKLKKQGEGHVGLVTRAINDKLFFGIDCASSTDGVTLRDLSFFARRRNVVFARLKLDAVL